MSASLACAPALWAHAAPPTDLANRITVLNQQSHPEVGGLWQVRFEARGTHDLTVSGADGTALGADVSFAELRDAAGRPVAPESDGGSLVFAGFEGGGIATLSVRVNTAGPHALLLGFGGDEAVARNYAYPDLTTEINGLTANGPQIAFGDQFGSSLAAMGDLDRDGVQDLAVGAWSDDGGGNRAGAVHLLFLNQDGTVKRTVEINASTANGPQLAAGDLFGSSLAAMGDLDRDGVPDLAAGAWGDDAGAENAGAVHLLFLNQDGTVKRTVEINASTANGPQLERGDFFGSSAAAVGDLDRDGTQDLAVGASEDGAKATDAGTVYVMFLNSDGTVKRTAPINASTANGPQLVAGDEFGRSVALMGDLDRDGTGDIAVGAVGDDAGGTDAGAVHLLYMNPDGTVKRTAEINASTANGPRLAASDFFGSSAAAVGDLDRDGVPDLAAGAWGRLSETGAVHLLFLNQDGTVKRTAEINASTANGPQLAAGDEFGRSVALMGDLDLDGIEDLAVGATGDDARWANAGTVHIVRLDVTAPSGDGTMRAVLRLSGDSGVLPTLDNMDRFGASAAVLGDINSDGVPDLAVGADRDDAGGTDRGAVYVALMHADGSIDEITKIASGTGGGPALSDMDYFGSSVAATGDLDGDGIPDMAVGAHGTDTAVAAPAAGATGADRGALYIVLLNSDGTAKSASKINDRTARGPALADNDWFGYSAAGIGDLDGDGVDDLAVGAPVDGAVHVLFMNQDRTIKETARVTSALSDVFDYFGSSVAAAGDLDGDGVADLAVGAVRDARAQTVQPGRVVSHPYGAVHVLLMNSDGTAKGYSKIDRQTPGGPALSLGAEFGSSVAAVGDLDGDGVPDIAAGAESNDGPGNNSGILHLLMLNSDGTLKSSRDIGRAAGGVPAPGAGDEFGSSVASLGDLDGDGVADLAVGAKSAGTGGDAYVLFMGVDSSVSRAVRMSESGPDVSLAAGDMFGSSVAGIGDLNRDGVEDLAVGAAGDRTGARNAGAVHLLFLGADGTSESRAIKAGTPNAPALGRGDMFGSSVAEIGDLDRDGVADLAAGAWGDLNETGAVHLLYMNSDGTVKRTVEIDGSVTNGPSLRIGDRFGSSVAGIGDLDRDGVPDLAAGAPRDGGLGSAHLIFLNSDGTVKSTAKLDSAAANMPSVTFGDLFGSSVAGIGDLDRDGVQDLAVGSSGRDAGGANRGAVHLLFLNSDGTLKPGAVELSSLTSNGPPLADGDRFGSSVARAGDVDRDGTEDLLAGADGSAYLMLLGPDGYVKETHYTGAAAAPGIAVGDRFGASVAAVGDLDGDGSAEFAVGGPAHDDSGNDDRGATYVMSAFRPPFVEGVGSTTPDGPYGPGSRIEIEVEFSEPVSVTGSPALLLETGATDRPAAYASGSGTDTLAFGYTVQQGDWSPDLEYVGRSSLTLRGGSVEASSDTAVLGLPRPGSLDSLSFSKDLSIDGIRPTLEATPRLDLALGALELDFDEPIDASEIDPGGVAVLGLASSTQLGGAAAPAQDADALALRLTGEQTRGLVLAHLRDGPLRITVSGSAFEDLVGNAFAGTTGAQLEVELALARDSPAFSDSARTHKSGFAPSSSPGLSSSERAHKSGFVAADTPAFSDPALNLNALVRASGDTAVFSDSARSYQSASVSSDTAALSASVRSHKSSFVEQNLAAFSDSAVSTSALVRASSDTAALSDLALNLNALVRASGDTAVFSDSVRAYKSSLVPSSSPVLTSSVAGKHAAIRTSSETVAFSDSARSYKSVFLSSDTAAFSDSASRADMKVSVSADTAAFSDSARSYKSVFLSSDTAAFSDSASRADMKVSVSADTAAFSDSARSYKSVFLSSDTAAFSDSASGANMVLSSLSDTAAFSDSARSYKSVFLSSDTAAFSDSASGANMVLSSLSDTAAFSDTASVASMRLAGLSDAATVSDSARAYRSGFAQSSSPDFSDSAGRAGMRVAVSADTGVFSDSAASFKSSASARDSLSPSDSASYAGLFVQGPSDGATFSDSARAYRSGSAQSSSPALSDSASGLAALSRPLSDSQAPSDSARAYKSSFPASSLQAPFDSARWGSARNASDSSSPTIADSALARVSSVAESDSPVLADSARAGASAILLSDSPVLGDGAATGSRASANAGDAPSVSDGAVHGEPAPAEPVPDPPGPGAAGRPADIARGPGGTGIALAVIHAVSYERCSEVPHARVAASPSHAAVTLEQAGAVTAARPVGQPYGAPDSAVWEAPILPDAALLEIRAAHRGGQAAGVSQIVDTESCSGSVRFTAFGALPDVRAPEPAAPPAAGAGPPEPEDAGATTDAPGPRASSAPAATPKTGSPPTTAPSDAPESAAPAPDGPGDLEAEPPAPKTATAQDAPVLLREPREPGRAAPAFELWHAAVAAGLAAAAPAAARLARKI